MARREELALFSHSEPVLAVSSSEGKHIVPRSSSSPAVVLSQPFQMTTLSPHVISAFKEDAESFEPRLYLQHPFQPADIPTLRWLLPHKEEALYYIVKKIGVAEGDAPTRTEIFLELLWEGVRFSRFIGLSEYQVVVMLNILYATQRFFLASEWKTAKQTYTFLKETLLLHTVQRPPWSKEVFQPLECQQLLEHITRHYIRHLPLVHTCSLPVHVVELSWTSKRSAEQEPTTSTAINPSLQPVAPPGAHQ